MPNKEQIFRLERFPSGKTISTDLLNLFAKSNVQIRDNHERYVSSGQSHVDNSRRLILSSASGLNGKVIIFGLGNGSDIPLEGLATQFDHLTIVEIDEAAATKTIGTLSPDLQEKCELVVDDISGVMSEYLRIVSVKRGSYLQQERVIRDIADEVKKIQPPTLSFGRDFNFACSSLIASQLGFFPHLVVSEYLRRQFKLDALSGEASQKYMINQGTVISDVHRKHMDLLRGSVKDGAKVYFSDTVAKAQTAYDEDLKQEVPTSGWLPMILPEFFNTVIPSAFDLLKREAWIWHKDPAKRDKTGSMFSVWAADLRAK